MFLTLQQRALRWTLCSAVALAPLGLAAQGEFSSANKSLGHAAVDYSDKNAHIVAAYYYSQKNHDSRWLMIQAAVATRDSIVIERKDIALRTPQGREIPLATQQRVGEDTVRVQQLLQNAKAVSHNVASYFAERDRVEDMKLFTLPFGGVVHDSFVTDRDHVVVGPLFFEAPTGAWERGTYALIVRHSKGTAELPINLE